MTEATRVLLANCAGSFLLLIVFLAFLGVAAVLVTALRYLGQGRTVVRERLAMVETHAERTAEVTESAARTIVEPQIRLASALAGLRAGARALWGGTGAEDGDPTAVGGGREPGL
jgi:hypothetical protein